MALKFIKDQEINLYKNDLLGTKPYVDALSEVIEQCETPFTIGLFGGWGTGKSSIIKTIKDKYNDDKKSKIKVFVYDSWKYSEDSFRRTFILKLKEDFQLEGGDEYQSFYFEKTEQIDHKTKLDKGKVFWGLFYIIPIFTFFIWLIPNTTVGYDVKSITTIFSILFSIIFYFLKDVFVQYNISLSKPKIFAPEQFENAFEDAVGQITIKPKGLKKILNWFNVGPNTIYADKLVVVIDNIDRCHRDVAFKLLHTIKTFLELKDKEIVFVVPVDENELTKHLNKEGHDGKEFLRKLFNTSLKLKRYSEDDLFYFIKDLNTTHQLGLNKDIFSLIAQEFSNSPRKIIQFINLLQSELKIAEEQEKKVPNNKSNFKKGIITNNVEFLVKIILIREEWPDLYSALTKNPYILDGINQKIVAGKPDISFGKNILTREQYRFLESTRDITSENIEVFFNLRDNYPNYPDDMSKLVLNQDWDTVKSKYFEENVLKLDQLITFLGDIFKREVINKGLLSRAGLNILSFLFKLSKDDKYGPDTITIYNSRTRDLKEIKRKLNSIDIQNIILSFNPKLLMLFISNNLNKNKALLNHAISVLKKYQSEDSPPKGYEELMFEYINSLAESSNSLKEIQSPFSEALKSNPDLIGKYQELLKNKSTIEALIEPDIIQSFIDSLENNPKASFTEAKSEIIKIYSSLGLMDDATKDSFVKLIFSNINSNTSFEIQAFWLSQLIIQIKNLGVNQSSLHTFIFQSLKNKYSQYSSQYNSSWKDVKYVGCLNNFLTASMELYLIDESAYTEVLNWLKTFYSKNESQSIILNTTKIYEQIIIHAERNVWSFSGDLVNKLNNIKNWEDQKKLLSTIDQMMERSSSDQQLNDSQVEKVLDYYIQKLDVDEDLIKKWFLNAIKNPFIEEKIKKGLEKHSSKTKLKLFTFLKGNNDDLLESIVKQIINELTPDGLEDAINTLKKHKITNSIIQNALANKISKIKIDDDPKIFKEFLMQIVYMDASLSQKLCLIILSKIKPLIQDDVSKEDKLFALKILDAIKIPKTKQKLFSELLNDLDFAILDSEALAMINQIKSRLN